MPTRPGLTKRRFQERDVFFIVTRHVPEKYEPGSKLLVLGMGNLQPLIGNPYNGYINPTIGLMTPYYPYGNIGSLDPSTYGRNMISKTPESNG